MKHVFKLILVLFLFTLASCNMQFEQNLPSIETTSDKVEMLVGETTQLNIEYKNVKDKTLNIEIEDNTIVSVDENLNVTALKEGTVKVVVSLKSDQNQKIEYTIEVAKPIEFEIIGNNLLLVGDEITYKTSLESDEEVVWESSNSEILSVQGNKVKALKEGIVTLTATYQGVTKEILITVEEQPLDFEISGKTSANVGDKIVLDVTNYNPLDLKWWTLDTDIVEVNNNVITALKPGTATIYASYKDIQKEFVITVEKDQIKPVISYYGKDSIVVNWNDTQALLNDVTASDNIDGDLTSKIVIKDGFDIQSYGKQVVTYEVSDSSGNTASITRNVEVIWNNQVSFIGHAGSYYGLMNSEEAILYAIQVLKYQYVEIDLKQTSDGVFVLSHDDTFGDYTLSTTPWSVLKDYQITKARNGGYPSNNGSVTGSPYTAGLCTLERFLDICKTYNVRPVIELKSSKGITNSDQSRMQALMDVIESYDMVDQIVFLASQYNCLIWTRENGYENVECQYLVNSCESETYLQRCIKYNLDISINVTGTSSNSEAWLARYKEAGLKISTYTYSQWVNYDVVQQWINKGVDFVTCDWHRMDVLSLPVNSGEIGVKHSVVFKDLDGTILKETSVKDGKTAAAPSDPSLIGYEFIGWDKDLTNIKEDTVFTACYKPINYSITYVSNLEKVVKTSFGSKEQFIEELYSDLFNWIASRGTAISGMKVNNGVYTFTRNGKTVSFSNVDELLALDIYDFELTISNILYKEVVRNSDGTCVILPDEEYFFNSDEYRIKYQGVDQWLYNAIVNAYDWYDDTYKPTSSGKIQIFFRMHQWAKGATIGILDKIPAKYEVVDESYNVVLPTSPTSYTIEQLVVLLPATSDLTFLGWYETPECDGDRITVIEKGSTGNIVLYAKWEKE